MLDAGRRFGAVEHLNEQEQSAGANSLTPARAVDGDDPVQKRRRFGDVALVLVHLLHIFHILHYERPSHGVAT